LSAYEVLRVAIDATQEQIGTAFFKEQEKWSPDRHFGEKTQEKARLRLSEVTRAYEQISTVESRKAHDAELKISVGPKFVRTVQEKQSISVTLSKATSGRDAQHTSELPPDELQTPSVTPRLPSASLEVDQTTASAGVSNPAVVLTGNSSEVTTGKWMVGVGLGIGVLLIFLVNSTKNETPRQVAVPVAQMPSEAAPIPLPPTPVPAPLVVQPTQEVYSPRSYATEEVEVLGQRVAFSNPKGYCTPGKSEREVELMDVAKRSLGEGSRLVHAAVLCSELEDYKSAQRETLDHWLQIQLIGPKGKFQRVDMAREAFLAGMSKSSPRVDTDEINRRLKASFDNRDINLTQMKFEPIGRDGNAAYFSMRMNMQIGDTSRPITGIGGITLLNSLPLSINVYDGTGSVQSLDQLQSVQKELLNSLLTEN
jgi:hypothetical protein